MGLICHFKLTVFILFYISPSEVVGKGIAETLASNTFHLYPPEVVCKSPADGLVLNTFFLHPNKVLCKNTPAPT